MKSNFEYRCVPKAAKIVIVIICESKYTDFIFILTKLCFHFFNNNLSNVPCVHVLDSNVFLYISFHVILLFMSSMLFQQTDDLLILVSHRDY
jgi:hypothetical protein